MIALLVLAAAVANISLVAMLAERFGQEGGLHASAGELTSLQASGRATPSTVRTAPANENALADADRLAA